MLRPSALSTALFLLAVSAATGLDLYVAPDGSDSNDGSVGSPFQSLVQAQTAVREASSQGDGQDIVVHVADGFYNLDEPLNLTSTDSGTDASPVIWRAEGSNAVLSGGLKVSDWQLNETSGIYSAQVPPGTESRNLYINGQAANYARSTLQRKDFDFDNETLSWNSTDYDWIMTTPGIESAEIRGINSFTDRYAPVESVGDKKLFMKNHAWRSTVMGYDTLNAPNADFGFYIQNALALLDEGGEFYLDSQQGIVYYMPLEGEDMSSAEAYLGILEGLVYVQGTLEEPIHDITFEGFHFAHTTWLLPGQGYGYVDQQTGAYICQNKTYPQFEAARPWWCQMPSAIRIAMASNIVFQGGSYSQLGSGGVGIGNDATAYDHGPGLGAQNVTIRGGYFNQVMGNSISAGGVREEAHHPNNTRSINSGIHISENVFHNVSSLFSSTVPIMFTYAQYSTITNNEIYTVPYSGICHGYGWGSNDANGTEEYLERGLYDYQPLFQTPTTSQNNLIAGNLIHDFGRSHTDLGAVYTLSKSPNTVIKNNYAQDGDWFGLYTDEGTNSYLAEGNVWMVRGNYYAPNQGPLANTANNTLIDNFGIFGADHYSQLNGSGIFNNTFIRNYIVGSLDDTSVEAKRTAYRAGVPPRDRASRTVYNPDVPRAHLDLTFSTTGSGTLVTLNISNFDDAELTSLSLQAAGGNLEEGDMPTTIPANSFGLATWNLASSPSDCSITPITVTASYTTNNATTSPSTLVITGTPPGAALPESHPLNSSSKAPTNATYGTPCPNTYAIRSGGRGLHPPFDDLSTLYLQSGVGSAANISAQIQHIDAITPSSYAGVVLRNQLQLTANGTNNFTGYAAVLATAGGEASFAYDSGYHRELRAWETVPGVQLPVWLRLGVQGVTISGFYSVDGGETWTRIGERGFVMQSHWAYSDAGIMAGSAGGWRLGTAVLGGFEITGSGSNALTAAAREGDGLRKREL